MQRPRSGRSTEAVAIMIDRHRFCNIDNRSPRFDIATMMPYITQELAGHSQADVARASERRIRARSPASVSAPSVPFPDRAQRTMASATRFLTSCCSPSGVFSHIRSSAASMLARVRGSKHSSIVKALLKSVRLSLQLPISAGLVFRRDVDNGQQPNRFRFRNSNLRLFRRH
jgi:hypothetical protein